MKINKKLFIIYILFFTTSCIRTADLFVKEKQENGIIVCAKNMCSPKYIMYKIDQFSNRTLFKLEPTELFIETNNNSYKVGTFVEFEVSSLKPVGVYKYTTSKGKHKVIPYFKEE